MSQCKVCKSRNVTEHKSTEVLADGVEVLIEFSICPLCPREFISKKQILHNQEAIKQARKDLP